MWRNMKAWKQDNNEKERKEKQQEKRRKKSQILYFDIFYVDLDSKAELYRGFFRRFRAISHEYVSCYLQIPAVRYIPKEKNMNMKWCIIFLCSSRLSNISNKVFFRHHNHKKKNNIFIDIYNAMFRICKISVVFFSKVILRVLHRTVVRGVERQKSVLTVGKRELLLCRCRRVAKFTWNLILQFIKCWTFSFCTKANYKNRISHLWLLKAVGVLVVFLLLNKRRDVFFFILLFCVHRDFSSTTNLTNF